jgi:hypothetical protein
MNAKYIELIAKTCHQANKEWCEFNGDFYQKNWGDAEEWQRQSAIKGVEFRLDNPNLGHDAQHNNWLKDKVADGWVWGEVKDPIARTHPCIIDWASLPPVQMKKDVIFCAIVDAFKLIDRFDDDYKDMRKLKIVKIVESELPHALQEYVGYQFPVVAELEMCPVCYELDTSSIGNKGGRAIVASMFCKVVENIEVKTKPWAID